MVTCHGKVQWAAVFDWDGVIVDSSAQHEESWERLAAKEGLDLPPDHFKRGFGMRNEYIIPRILHWTDDAEEVRRLADRKEALYRALVHEEGIEPLPGVSTWLDQLEDVGVPCAIGSSTPRANITCVLDALGWHTRFGAIACGDEVEHGKPAPDIFLLAAEKLRVAPACCVVFEDAHVGIEAGLAAGMQVVAVTTTHSRETLDGAILIVDRLDELTRDTITGLFS
jgi:beta-phosphoglucomutase family hydrolase